MTSTMMLPAFDRFLDQVIESMTPEQILAFQASEQEQTYAQQLIYRNNEGTLTPDETAQLEQMLYFERMMQILKVKALKRRNNSPH